MSLVIDLKQFNEYAAEESLVALANLIIDFAKAVRREGEAKLVIEIDTEKADVAEKDGKVEITDGMCLLYTVDLNTYDIELKDICAEEIENEQINHT